MPSSYTPSLRLTLPVTGELSGQWGTTVNNGITELLDSAVAGTATISTWGGAGVAYTLSNNNGAADEARKMFIVATGSPGEAKNVICPAVSKLYVFRNDTTGGFALTLKTSGGTGIAVAAGQAKLLYCDGTNVVEAVNALGPLANLTASQAVFTDASKNLVSNAITGTGNVVMSASPTLTGTVGAASLTLSSLTSGRVTYAGASGLLQDSANLTFNGTDLTVSGAVNAGSVNATTLDLTNLEVTNIKAKDGTASASIADSTGVMSLVANPVFSGGTANGVLYLNGSKVATSGSALTFDGTNFATTGSITSSSGTQGSLVLGSSSHQIKGGSFFGDMRVWSDRFRWYDSTGATLFGQVDSTGINSTAIGATTPSTGAFTTLSTTGNVTLGDASTDTVQVNGYMGVGGAGDASRAINVTSSALTGANQTGVYSALVGSASATSTVRGFTALVQTAAAAFTVADVAGFWYAGASKGAGSTITNSHGLYVPDLTAGVNNYGITSLVSSGTNKWNIYASGTAQNYFAGNVGIGTASPATNLHISQTGAVAGEYGVRIGQPSFTGNFGAFSLDTSGGRVLLKSSSSYPLAFDVNGSEQMRLTSTGLGIGTSSPTNKLTVDGNANITGNVTLGDASTDTVTVNGYMGVGGAGNAAMGVRVIPNALTGASQYGIVGDPISTNAATTLIAGVWGRAQTSAAAYTTSDLVQFYAAGSVKGAGSTITNQHGVYIVDQTQGTNNYGITSAVSSGSNKWNIYASGTAANYFAGNVGIGTSSPNYLLHIHRAAAASSIIQLTNTSSGTTAGDGFQLGLTNALLAEIWQYENADLRIGTNNTERLRIDSSGNLGLGVVPSAWGTNVVKAIQVGTGAGFGGNTASGNPDAYMMSNCYYDGTNWKYIGTDAAMTFDLRTNAGGAVAAVWNIAPSGTAGNTITFTQAMTLDASGNLGLGVTPSAWLSGDKAFEAAYAGLVGATGTSWFLNNAFRDSGLTWRYRYSNSAARFELDANAFKWYTAPSGTAGAAITFTQAMTLNASSQLLVGTTTNTNSSTVVSGGTISETVSGTQYLVASQFDIGTAPNEIPLNQYLGTLAYEDAANVAITGGVISVSAGAAATPSLSFTGDTDTGLWSPAANTLAASTGGTERLRLDSSGNLGIGTSSPNALLDVVGGSAGAQSVIQRIRNSGTTTGTGASLSLMANTNSTVAISLATIDAVAINTTGGGDLFFRTSNASGALTERLRLDSSGNLGLGVVPSAWGAAYKAFQFGFGGSLSSTTSVPLVALGNNSYYNGSNNIYKGSGVAQLYVQDNGGSHLWYNAPSGTAGAAISFTQAMTLDASGNLLVGTTSNPASYKAIVEKSGGELLGLNASSGTLTRIAFGNADASFGSTQIIANSTALAFVTASAERARIDSSGNLLITSTGGLGYGTGSGGTVTQATSRTTGVTLNKTNGAITLVSAAGSTAWQSFTVTNSTVAATDVIKVCQKSGTDLYLIHVTNVAAGSFRITFATTGGTTTEQPVFNFAVIKAVTA